MTKIARISAANIRAEVNPTRGNIRMTFAAFSIAVASLGGYNLAVNNIDVDASDAPTLSASDQINVSNVNAKWDGLTP
jgi:hypothetical protein